MKRHLDVEEVVLVGAALHANDVVSLIWAINKYTEKVGFTRKILGYVDDNAKLQGKKIDGYEVLGGLDWFENGHCKKAVIAIGGSRTRKHVVDKLRDYDLDFVSLIHPHTYIPENTKIGKGVKILNGVEMSGFVTIGDFVDIHISVKIGHLTKIGNFASLFPACHIIHNTVGEGVEIGGSSVILPSLRIGRWSKIGAGSRVTENVKPYAVVMGIPAREVRRENDKY